MPATIIWPAKLRLTPAARVMRCRESASGNCADYDNIIAAGQLQWRGICKGCVEEAGYNPVCHLPYRPETAPGFNDAACANCGAWHNFIEFARSF